MPIFEYKCQDCSAISEFLEKHGSKTAHKCSKCGSKKLKKQFSTFTGHIKEPADQSKCQSCPSGGSCPNAQF